MTRATFNNSLMLGFEHMERLLDRANRSSDSYPPYNIEHLSQDKFRSLLRLPDLPWIILM